jgi:UDP-glucuronate 4-epimerase
MYLVTGAAGFIGFHTCARLLERGETVIGVDNMNEYYDVGLKEARLQLLLGTPGFAFRNLDIADQSAMEALAQREPSITVIIHLAAQAGVRYSLTNPHAYSHSNLVGQVVMLEMARHLPRCKHFVYASSSSVYGSNGKLPFAESDNVDHPVSLYAATKKSCELMAHTYSHLFAVPTTGLRFFTVYGPWGRPDMSPFIFVKSILAGKPITVFNHGDMRRDFTYIDDVVTGVVCVADRPPATSPLPYRVYNIGNGRSERLLDFVSTIEGALGVKAKIMLADMQPGDVKDTFADIGLITQDHGFHPNTSIHRGIPNFVRWYQEYYGSMDVRPVKPVEHAYPVGA